jgi:hypothetical protein
MSFWDMMPGGKQLKEGKIVFALRDPLARPKPKPVPPGLPPGITSPYAPLQGDARAAGAISISLGVTISAPDAPGRIDALTTSGPLWYPLWYGWEEPAAYTNLGTMILVGDRKRILQPADLGLLKFEGWERRTDDGKAAGRTIKLTVKAKFLDDKERE